MLKNNLTHNETYQLFANEQYADEIKDGYQLNWVGKNYAKYVSGLKSVTVLEPDESHNALDENRDSQNVYITGDNLEVLKHLQNAYTGKVDMIYIDPPYNTGKEFVYNDDFRFTDAEFAEKLGLQESEIARVRQLNGRSSHSAWLTFMYPRLRIAQRLLKETGVIFISIDDNEQAQLKLLCDEVFGEGNFVGEIVWQTATDNNPTQVATEHEYVLVYVKQIGAQDYWEVSSEKGKIIQEKYEELKGQFGNDVNNIQKALRKWIKQQGGDDLSGVAHYSYVDDKGVYYPGNSANTRPGGYTYDIVHPKTNKVCAKPNFGYRWTQETFESAVQNGDVMWGNDESIIPKIKKRLDTVTEKLKSYYYEDNRATSGELKALFGGVNVFDNPKSLNFLNHIFRFILPVPSLAPAEREPLAVIRERIRRKFEDMAVVLQRVEFTPVNFRKLFGNDSAVDTPVGKITLGRNQFEKLQSKERENLLWAMRETLAAPVFIMKEHREADPQPATL
ncbi:MAG: site-specific DNA-methyltransferase, partial [Planctomycetaceae bacterium]|nr:site-specific DNA-methyltransferase [Planctomycetaceae bacterium]